MEHLQAADRKFGQGSFLAAFSKVLLSYGLFDLPAGLFSFISGKYVLKLYSEERGVPILMTSPTYL